ncbi:MAG: RNA polymerase sigma factor [Muribaculaceae bacterium]|nr:RNA polymerase sigma factor [Roseburia sp.]MCM1430083.1 RNA polymerase sigma factor [Muribaculaceae bacterium]MCM1493954.1 RNA polymerase sigma factor [Muribaculaceae bacterium]
MSGQKVKLQPGLIERVAQGESRAFEELYTVTYRPMYAFCLSLTMNNADAEDLLQDTYIRVRNAAHLYKEQGNPMAWIMKIAQNLYRMRLRGGQGRQTEVLENEDRREELSFDQIRDVDNRLLLEELFVHLSEEERNIVILHGLMGLKFQEVAEKEDKPLGTVITKYNRAIKRLHHIVNHGRKEVK